jgi:hypothetical protein
MSKSPEHTLQKQIVGYLRSNGILTISTDVMSGLMFLGNPKLPSVQKKRMIYINHHKSLGYTAGQPDIVLLLKDGETLLVELKDGKKGKQSSEQGYFEVLAKLRSHNYVVWRSVQDAVDFVQGYKKL